MDFLKHFEENGQTDGQREFMSHLGHIETRAKEANGREAPVSLIRVSKSKLAKNSMKYCENQFLVLIKVVELEKLEE